MTPGATGLPHNVGEAPTIEEVATMEIAVPILPVEDLPLATQFYIERLGFDLEFEASEDGKTGLLAVRRGTIQITLGCPMMGHGRDACVSLRVNDADKYYERVALQDVSEASTAQRAMGRTDL